jgi:Cdc6-like AAA superfamily ATPase
MINPFSPQHPAQPNQFAGRHSELDYFRSTALNSAKMPTPAPLNYAVLGTWGLGKTSLIYEYRQIALQELRKATHCVTIHCALSPQSCRSWESFTASLLTAAKSKEVNATNTIKSRVTNEISKWEPNFNIGIVGAQRKGRGGAADLLTNLSDLWQDHLKPSGTDIAFILLDDLHYFPIKSEESAYLTLRSTFQELANQGCNYSLIVTAHSNLFTELAEVAEPLLRFFKTSELQPFTLDETKEAVEKRLASSGDLVIDDAVIEIAHKKTAGHPYLLMFTFYELLQKLAATRRVKEADFSGCWPHIESLLGQTLFKQKFQSASEKERGLLVKIAKSHEVDVSPKSFRAPNILFTRLEQKELLIHQDRGRYTLFHPLFKEYLARQ